MRYAWSESTEYVDINGKKYMWHLQV